MLREPYDISHNTLPRPLTYVGGVCSCPVPPESAAPYAYNLIVARSVATTAWRESPLYTALMRVPEPANHRECHNSSTTRGLCAQGAASLTLYRHTAAPRVARDQSSQRLLAPRHLDWWACPAATECLVTCWDRDARGYADGECPPQRARVRDRSSRFASKGGTEIGRRHDSRRDGTLQPRQPHHPNDYDHDHHHDEGRSASSFHPHPIPLRAPSPCPPPWGARSIAVGSHALSGRDDLARRRLGAPRFYGSGDHLCSLSRKCHHPEI